MSKNIIKDQQTALSMFGVTEQQLKDDIQENIALWGTEMLAISMLSDAQEMIAYGASEGGRQYINRVKYLLANYGKDQINQKTS